MEVYLALYYLGNELTLLCHLQTLQKIKKQGNGSLQSYDNYLFLNACLSSFVCQ